MQVRKCLEICWQIVEFERQDLKCTFHVASSIPNLTAFVVTVFGIRFYEKHMRLMITFFESFTIWNAVQNELVSTHPTIPLRIVGTQAHHWFKSETAKQNWSAHTLIRQVGFLFFERLLFSRDRHPVNKRPSCRLFTC
jgi:hypothetical protein